MLKRLVLVCGVSRQSCKQSGMLHLVSEQTSPSTVWFGDEPGGSWWACNTHDVAFDIPPVGYERFPPVGTGTIRKDDPTLIRGTESHRNERDPEAV